MSNFEHHPAQAEDSTEEFDVRDPEIADALDFVISVIDLTQTHEGRTKIPTAESFPGFTLAEEILTDCGFSDEVVAALIDRGYDDWQSNSLTD